MTSNLSTKKQIIATTTDLLALAGYKNVKIEVKKQVDGSFNINLTLNPEDSGILIGHHGETVSALQLLVGIILYQQLGAWQKILLNINDYRDQREASLKEIATAAAEKALNTKEEVVLPYMSSFERRLIHMALADNKQVVTKSIGEGRDRRLVVAPQKD